jgi:hypothetical protein
MRRKTKQGERDEKQATVFSPDADVQLNAKLHLSALFEAIHSPSQSFERH